RIQRSEKPGQPAPEPALWVDYGKDYYAAVSWSDIPKSDGRRLWLGWMSNWEYAQEVPTSPWRSAMSIPRQVGLRRTAAGLRLVQKPVREQTALRKQHYRFKGGDIAAANTWLKDKGIQGDQLELLIKLPESSDGVQGLRLFQGSKEATVIGVDHKRGCVFVDRTQSGQVNFHPKFPGVHEAPLLSHKNPTKLHIFVDACSVEVFVNDGESVLTDLVFPSPTSRGIEFFGPEDSARVGSVEVWELKSSWK
ncbi:MAG TPA: GH32 C-terminal domain-containing protein, partial [Clostridia bacterium]|nr:GH32 C-terminal domain-containing protein [Clostridia bacterium]